MPLNLDGKKWPKRANRAKSWASMDWSAMRKYSLGIFVTEGQLYSKELSFYGMTRPIPAEECAITSLCKGNNFRMAGATSGKKAHLFSYCPKGPDGVVVDIGPIGEETAVKNSLVVTDAGVIIGGTSSFSGEKYDGGKIFEHVTQPFSGDFIQEWQIMKQKINIVTVPVKGEGIGGLLLDKQRNLVYGISDKTGTLFAYDIKTKKVKKLGLVNKKVFSTCITIDQKGRIFGAGYGGKLFCNDPEQKNIQTLEIFMPTFAGRNLYDMLSAAAFDGKNNLLYGGTREGNLFVFNPANFEIKSLGCPTNLRRIRCLSVTNDGRVFGMSGEDEEMNHMFSYNPKTGELKDLGIPIATMEKRWYGYRIDCMAAGFDGAIYLGESDRVSNLFIYHPAII